MAEKLVSNHKSKPAPVRQFPHLLLKFFSVYGDWFPCTECSGKAISLSISGVPSKLGKDPFFASCNVLSKSRKVKNSLLCSILSDTLVEN